MGMYKLTIYLEGINTPGDLGVVTADDNSGLLAIIGAGTEDNVYKIEEYRRLISKYAYNSYKNYVLIIGYDDSNMTCAIPFRNIRAIIGETLEGV